MGAWTPQTPSSVHLRLGLGQRAMHHRGGRDSQPQVTETQSFRENEMYWSLWQSTGWTISGFSSAALWIELFQGNVAVASSCEFRFSPAGGGCLISGCRHCPGLGLEGSGGAR